MLLSICNLLVFTLNNVAIIINKVHFYSLKRFSIIILWLGIIIIAKFKNSSRQADRKGKSSSSSSAPSSHHLWKWVIYTCVLFSTLRKYNTVDDGVVWVYRKKVYIIHKNSHLLTSLMMIINGVAHSRNSRSNICIRHKLHCNIFKVPILYN